MFRWRSRTAAAAILVIAAFVASALAIIRSRYDLPLFASAFGIFTAPGWPLARWLLGRRTPRLARAPFALLLGYLTGLTAYILLRLTVGTAPFIVLIACAFLAVTLATWLPRDSEPLLPLPPMTRGDGLAIATLLLVVATIVGPVFANVGRETPGGLAYRAYFNADLFAHMSVVAELTRNTMPPVNPYAPAEALPYYWGYFTFPALYDDLHDLLVTHVVIDRGILLTDLVMAGVYVSIWFLVLRGLGASTIAALVGWLLVILASSFEGAFFWWTQLQRHRSIWEFRYLNIDALTRWYWDLPPTDGLHRLFWYTPQHGFAITLGVVLFGLIVLTPRPTRLARGLVDGLLLGGMLVCSSFNGLLFVAAYAITEVITLVRTRGTDFSRWLIACSFAAFVVLCFTASALALGMIQKSATAVILRLNPHLLRGPWAFVALSFGPALLLAPVGLRRLAQWSKDGLTWTTALLAVSLAAFLFVDVRGHENAYVVFRTAHLWYVLLAVLAAAGIDAARAWPRPAMAALGALIGVGTILAVPTVALDWYNARDITNLDMSPGGFPWTVYITPANQAALAWIETMLPADAMVQMDPDARGRATWALIPAFSEHRLPIGRGIFEPNPRRFDEGAGKVRVIYRTPDPKLAYAYCEYLGIEYLYVGPEERQADGPSVDKFARDTDDFTAIYSVGGVAIYRVRGMTARLNHNHVTAMGGTE
jgi:hypothetical protein